MTEPDPDDTAETPAVPPYEEVLKDIGMTPAAGHIVLVLLVLVLVGVCAFLWGYAPSGAQ